MKGSFFRFHASVEWIPLLGGEEAEVLLPRSVEKSYSELTHRATAPKAECVVDEKQPFPRDANS